jgi:hypothetical protein
MEDAVEIFVRPRCYSHSAQTGIVSQNQPFWSFVMQHLPPSGSFPSGDGGSGWAGGKCSFFIFRQETV